MGDGLPSLNVCVSGDPHGANLVLVHGWGMNAAVWEPVLPFFEKKYCVHRIDLPGHGQSELNGAAFQDWVAQIESVLPEEFHYVGWSLGGLLGLEVARVTPKRVLSFSMIASTPMFVKADAWPAMKLSMLKQFAEELKTNLSATIKTFLALQFYGMDSPRVHLRSLQKAVLGHGGASMDALEAGLAFLESVDARDEFSRLSDVLVLLGGKDRLVPVALKESLEALNPRADVRVNEKAGHAPFVSDPEWVASALMDRLERLHE